MAGLGVESHRVDGGLSTTAILCSVSAPDFGLSLNAYWLLSLDCCFCHSGLLSGDCILTTHCYYVGWGHGEHETVFSTPISVLSHLPSPPLCSPRFAHLQMSQCVDLPDVFVYWVGNLLLNYSCPTCNFRGKDLEVFSNCHIASFTFLTAIIM